MKKALFTADQNGNARVSLRLHPDSAQQLQALLADDRIERHHRRTTSALVEHAVDRLAWLHATNHKARKAKTATRRHAGKTKKAAKRRGIGRAVRARRARKP